MMKLGFTLMVAAAAVGCAGDDDGGGGIGGTGPVTMAQAQDICMSSCEHKESCGTLDTAGGETVATCTDSCVGDIGGGGYRQDVVQDVFACMEASCTATDDECLTCTPTATHESFETTCRAKAAECGISQEETDAACETTPSGTNDTGFYCFFTPEVMNALAACFDMDCMAIGDCFNTVATQYDIDL